MAELTEYDVIIIGTGHNGLTCASYLARAGLRTALFERRDIVGGACVAEEIFEGCKVSTGAAWYGMLRERIVNDLGLQEHGLQTYVAEPQLVSLQPDGGHLILPSCYEDCIMAVEQFAGVDEARRFREFSEYADQIVSVLSPLMLQPLKSGELQQRFVEAGLGAHFDEISRGSMLGVIRRFLRDDRVAAALCTAGLAIANKDPESSHTAFALFYMMLAEIGDRRGLWGFARGGMGSVSAALAASAKGAGAEIHLATPVEEILIDGDGVTGVRLGTGTTVKSRFVVSNADPTTTFTQLLPAEAIPTDVLLGVHAARSRGAGSSVHLLLNRVPEFSGLAAEECMGLMQVSPSTTYLSEAAGQLARNMPSARPVITFSMQSLTDNGVAPDGKHLLTGFVQFTPYAPQRGGSRVQETVLERTLSVLEIYAPRIRDCIEESACFGPVDFESRFGIVGGHPEHVEMSLDHLFGDNAITRCAGSRTCISRLYLCGACTHPGGTVTGAPGFNAAHTILAEAAKMDGCVGHESPLTGDTA